MSWIKEVEMEEAEAAGNEELALIYRELIEKRGKIANILKVHSLNQKAMQGHLDLYMSIMFARTGITRPESEMIATVVSQANSCEYCKNHHGESLNRYWKDGDKVQALTNGYKNMGLSEREISILDYAVKLTSSPGQMVEDDVEKLRNIGLDDQAILNVALITSYFCFVNRVAMGLGVEYSEEELKGYKV
ncbi:MAG: peroxidase-related enzyme [Thermoplasmata archaeon]|nr:peroxidase-related enzyme [Thermoplasmata archaeon]